MVKQTGSLGAVESVKVVSDIYSPVSGQVVEVNEELEISPELVNQDPYGKGWIALIKPSNLQKELEMLMTPEQYTEHLRKLEQK